MAMRWEEISYPSGGERVRGVWVASRDVETSERALVLAPGRDRDVRALLGWLAEPLVEAGFLLVGISYRDRDVGYHETDIEDVIAAVSFVIARSEARRIGVIGHSRGGSAVLNAAAHDPRIGSVIALAPVTDHVRYVRGLQHYAPGRYEALVAAHGGTPEEVPAHYRAISAIERASAIKAPVLLVHGTLDLVVPMEHSQWMLEALKAAGNHKARLEILPNVGHFFERTFQGYVFDEVRRVCVQWLEETLPPDGREIVPGPEKPQEGVGF